jgi:hypothetical protein
MYLLHRFLSTNIVSGHCLLNDLVLFYIEVFQGSSLFKILIHKIILALGSVIQGCNTVWIIETACDIGLQRVAWYVGDKPVL